MPPKQQKLELHHEDTTAMLSVILPVRDRLPEFELCLAALQPWRTEGCELIVVDDGSAGNVREIAERNGARYLRSRRKQGPAGARNLGARYASGEYLVFVDADVVVSSNALHIIRREFDQQPGLAALFGSYDDNPGCSDFFSLFKNLLHHHVHQTSNPEATTFWSGCGAIRKSVFETAGGFNATRYPNASIEDIELGIRLTQQQQKVRLVKDLQVKHLKKWTPGSLVRTDIFQRAVPWTQLIMRTGNMPPDLNLTWASRLSAMLVIAAILLVAGLAGIFMNLLRWPSAGIAAALLGVTSTLLFLNHKLYMFFWRKHGKRFASSAILAHWAYFFYSALTFLVCCGAELLQSPLHVVVPPSELHRDVE